MRVLVAGWFSFQGMGATAGDLLARDVLCRWLSEAGCGYDVALAAPFTGGLDWRTVPPDGYSHVVFVCGPFGNGWPIPEFLERFGTACLIGVNLSMLESLEAWNPFNVLIERDSSRTARPDLVFMSEEPAVPVVGVVLVHRQREYSGGLHQQAADAIRRLADSQPMAIVPIDTRLDANATGLRCSAEAETLIARMDVVLTTRLHGMVLALKHGVPVVAVDPIAGGAKISRQARTIGWPHCYVADALNDQVLMDAFRFCLTPKARMNALSCARHARQDLATVREQFMQALLPERRAR